MDPADRQKSSSTNSRPSRSTSNKTCAGRALIRGRTSKHMASRPTLTVCAFAAGAAIVTFTPGLSTRLQRAVGIVAPAAVAQREAKPTGSTVKQTIVAMDDERIKLAQIEQRKIGPGTVAKRLAVPGTIVPDADRVAHVSVKLAGAVAEPRKNIGDDVTKGEILGALESREVADAKSEYLASRLSDELQQDLAERDKSAWEKRAIPEQQYIKSRNAAAQTAMRFDIARQKLMALGVEEGEISEIPQAPQGSLRLQNVRAPISGRLVE